MNQTKFRVYDWAGNHIECIADQPSLEDADCELGKLIEKLHPYISDEQFEIERGEYYIDEVQL